MGHLLEYSGIVTKTRAMESRLLSPGQFQELASLHTIPEAVEYLKNHYRSMEVKCRFDVVGIEEDQICWIKNAFEFK